MFDTYLGLPAMIGRSRLEAFQRIKDKVCHRISNWKIKFLSQAGKGIFIETSHPSNTFLQHECDPTSYYFM
jgi:hypothetical protein